MTQGKPGPAAAEAEPSTTSPFVLVVDDEKNFARRLSMEFEEAGFRSEAVYDGPAAMETIRKQLPDLIVLDVRMPGMDGLECLRTLHADSGLLTPPVILLTGDTSPRVDAAALVYPGSFVLSKPCTYDTVVRVATRLLNFV